MEGNENPSRRTPTVYTLRTESVGGQLYRPAKFDNGMQPGTVEWNASGGSAECGGRCCEILSPSAAAKSTG